MNLESRTILQADLLALRDVARNRLDILTLRSPPSGQLLQVMVEGGELALFYPSEGPLDLAGILRFMRFGLRRRMRPRFEWWGRGIIAVRLGIGNRVDNAVDIVAAAFAEVFGLTGAFTLEFKRMGWQGAQQV